MLCLARVVSYLHFKRLHPSASAVAPALAADKRYSAVIVRDRLPGFKSHL